MAYGGYAMRPAISDIRYPTSDIRHPQVAHSNEG
jgi:hypothetical protein